MTPDLIIQKLITNVTVIKMAQGITITKVSPNATLIKRPKTIQVTAQTAVIVPVFIPFFFSATQGQTVFTLPSNSSAVLLLAVNGAAQSQTKGDFTVSGNVITLSSGVDLNDEVFGIYVQA